MTLSAMIGAFSLSTCAVQAVPATPYTAAGQKLVAVPTDPTVLLAPCPDAAAYARLAVAPRPADADPAMVEDLGDEPPKLETTRCGVIAGGRDAAYDFALAEYRVAGDTGPDRFLQVVRLAKRRAARKTLYFRRFSGEVDSRTAVRAVCDFDGDGVPDVVLDVCSPAGCGAGGLFPRPRTGELDYRTIIP